MAEERAARGRRAVDAERAPAGRARTRQCAEPLPRAWPTARAPGAAHARAGRRRAGRWLAERRPRTERRAVAGSAPPAAASAARLRGARRRGQLVCLDCGERMALERPRPRAGAPRRRRRPHGACRGHRGRLRDQRGSRRRRTAPAAAAPPRAEAAGEADRRAAAAAAPAGGRDEPSAAPRQPERRASARWPRRPAAGRRAHGYTVLLTEQRPARAPAPSPTGVERQRASTRACCRAAEHPDLGRASARLRRACYETRPRRDAATGLGQALPVRLRAVRRPYSRQ